ncbi:MULTISPECIES: Uma2 family endonuclease [unclassified Synechocystis]|nr:MULTISPECIES: Uma2 family endonuclease [unclassified Synechocystis]UOO12280.1 Uma2 family endonuclease [Synechocystis sp. PCC 6803]BAM50903.1 hypothetical protein BEST7613_1972 [Synechocystis sp. PCC 6803] [Bacillus subtilis BEST7613]
MVTPTLVKTIATAAPQTFDQFLKQCPEEGRFEWVNGKIIEMVNTREHKLIAEFILFAFHDEIRRLSLNFDVTTQATIRTEIKTGGFHGRIPDVSVIDRHVWRSDPGDYRALTEPVQLAVEVVSSNWETDYFDKLDEYQRLGIKEYWIVDYLAIGSRDILGEPKQPTVSIYTLNPEGVYDRQAFQGQETLVSPTFAELVLTPEQIFNA